jgi:hypothetical protein
MKQKRPLLKDGYKNIQYNTIQYNTIQYNTIQYNDWFSTSRILAHILLVEKNKMAAQTEFPTFANEKTASCSLFIAFIQD